MKKMLFLTLFFAAITASSQSSFYDFTVKTITGEPFPLNQLKGKKVMVVNTASKCGLTPQYEGLEALYKKYQDKNFVIIGFPANNFMHQEPGTNEEIAEFCSINYGVTFPMMEKISVKGDDMHPLYQWLTEKTQNGVEDSQIKWNFQKYLIDEKGQLVKVVAPQKKPDSDEVLSWLNP
ncbi:MAG: glutathione peroxidase [Bacteroidales bacterium]|nr:glutathione peroxidase [Bacteroidales bacterium]MDY0287152.1 glutathione peroxidase [Bacteroidales bacterium]NCC74302.1 glutathione peroxidase [Sphingobacteriia bacterium]